MSDAQAHSHQPIGRDELIALLETRGRLLAPGSELIERSLRRCARYDMRQGKERFSNRPEAAERTGTTEALDDLNISDLTPKGSQVSARLAQITGGVPPTVASAATVSDQAADSPLSVDRPAPGPPQLDAKGMFVSGSEVAGYRIEGRLGRGGMGDVYRATQLSMGREVAFKVLAKKLSRDPVFRTRFLREARAAGRLQHPNLIAVHDVGEEDGLLFFSMELVSGKSIGDLLKDKGSYSEEEALVIIGQVLEALRYAHAHGLVHRDIKPDNIMVTDRGMVKVADLGLARQVEDQDSSVKDANNQTKSGTMMGTPYYMPPEQGQDARHADARSDIYSTGATLYHMVVGTVPFRGRTPVEVVVNATTKPLRFPEGVVSPKLRRVISRMMDKDPAGRPHDAEEALLLLQRITAKATVPHTGPSGRFHGRADATHRSADGGKGLTLWLLIGVVVLCLLIGTLILVDRAGRTQAWQAFTAMVDQDIDAGNYEDALERIEAFQSTHPSKAQQARALGQDVLAQWNRESKQALDEHLVDYRGFLRNNDFRSAQRVLDVAQRTPDMHSPEVTAELERLQIGLAKQQEIMIDDMITRVGEMIAQGYYRNAVKQFDRRESVTPEYHYLINRMLRHVGEAWDRGVADSVADDLQKLRRVVERNGNLGPAFNDLANQSNLLSPMVLAQLGQVRALSARSGKEDARFNPRSWFAASQILHRGDRPEQVEGGDGFQFEGHGRMGVFEDLDIPAGTVVHFNLALSGGVHWVMEFGASGEGCFILVTHEGASIGTIPEVTPADWPALEGLEAHVLRSGDHPGEFTIRTRWLEDVVEVSIPGLNLEPQRVPRHGGRIPIIMYWAIRGSLVVDPVPGGR